MPFTEIRYEKRGHVGVITLDRPDARNALTYTTYAELEDAVRTTDARCLRHRVRRNAMRRRPRVARPRHERRARLVLRDAQPTLGVGAELLEVAPRLGLRAQEIALPLDRDRGPDRPLHRAEPRRGIPAPRAQEVGVDDESDLAHTADLTA